MDVIIIIAVVFAAIVGLDLAAVTWGSDSRPGMTDDHAR
jgi:hypothetical protein